MTTCKKIMAMGIMLLLSFSFVSAVGESGIGDNDEWGRYFFAYFEMQTTILQAVTTMFPSLVEGTYVIHGETDTITVIDLNDTAYDEEPVFFEDRLNELTFLSWTYYLEWAYRFIAPRDYIYMKATDGTVVRCAPHDSNDDGIYEMLCQATP